MPRPPVIAHHLIWTACGYWLPNDPRGSTSRTIASDVIAELGELHYGRREVQPSSGTIRQFQQRAKAVLKFPLLQFGPQDVRVPGDAFAEVISQQRYTCYACAIMPDHVHALIRKHKHQAEEMIAHFQEAGRLRLRSLGRRTADHPVCGGPGWKVFQDHPDVIRGTIEYIENNPVKWNLPRQIWPFVKPYDGWPLHPGDDPNSPYARRLRGYRRK